MSEDYTISLYVDLEDQAEAFGRMAKRLARRADFISGKVLLVSRQSLVFSLSELPEIIQEFAPKLFEVDSIEISYAARHRSGHPLVYYLVWNGTSSLPGIRYDVQFRAPLRVNIDVRYLSVPEEVSRIRPLTYVKRPELDGQSVPEAIAFFLDVCGLSYRSENLVRHAVFSFSGDVKFSEQTRVLYHRDIQEFAYDLLRTFVYMQWGLPVSALLRYRGDLSLLTEAIIQRTWSAMSLDFLYEKRDYILQYTPSDPYSLAAQHYRARLTHERIQRVLELPVERIRALIVEICQKEHDLVCYDYGERGLVVAFDLDAYMWIGIGNNISSLYKIYSRLLDEVGA